MRHRDIDSGDMRVLPVTAKHYADADCIKKNEKIKIPLASYSNVSSASTLQRPGKLGRVETYFKC